MSQKKPIHQYTPNVSSWELIKKEAVKAVVPSAITLGGLAVVTYFGYLSLLTRVSAMESGKVDKSVQTEVDKRLEGKIDLLLNHFDLTYSSKNGQTSER